MRPVYIAGSGAVTPFGNGTALLADEIFAGRSALRELERFTGVSTRSRVAAEFPASTVSASAATEGLAFHAALVACLEALGPWKDLPKPNVGLVLATTKADLSWVNGAMSSDANPLELGLSPPHLFAARLAQTLGISGPQAAVSCACASGLSAIAVAARWIAQGKLEHVLVVGVDVLSGFIVSGFSSLLALDRRACRPFDATRDGLSLGEGAGAMLFTSDQGLSVGVRVAGWGGSNEAQHIKRPHADGTGLRLAAERALAVAKVSKSEIACIHLHGTGTPYNDAMEANAMVGLFDGATPPAFGTKAQTGHTLGAAGIIESLIAIAALTRGECPPNVGLETPDVDPRLDLTRTHRSLDRRRSVLKVAAGFGGIGAAVVYTR